MSNNISKQHAKTIATVAKFKETHNHEYIQSSLLRAQRYAVLYKEEIQDNIPVSGIVEDVQDVCAFLDQLFSDAQCSIFELPEHSRADQELIDALTEELEEQVKELDDHDIADKPQQYRNITEVESNEGMQVDKGALWDKRGDKFVLIDEDEYITHDFNQHLFKIAN